MKQVLTLINNEKKNLVITTAKGCSTDYTGENTPCSIADYAICTSGTDWCETYDYAACGNGQSDYCRQIDNSGCYTEGDTSFCNIDQSYCAESKMDT